MYVRTEHYIDDEDFEGWLSDKGLTLDDAYHDYSLINEYMDMYGADYPDVVQIL